MIICQQLMKSFPLMLIVSPLFLYQTHLAFISQCVLWYGIETVKVTPVRRTFLDPKVLGAVSMIM